MPSRAGSSCATSPTARCPPASPASTAWPHARPACPPPPCSTCVPARPPRVPPSLIVSRARMELHEQEGHPWGQSFAFRSILPRPGALRFLHGLSRAAQVTGLHALARFTGLSRWLGTGGALMEHVGPLPRQTAYRRARDLPAVTAPVRGRLGFLVCCYQNLAVPQATEATMRVLLANGY